MRSYVRKKKLIKPGLQLKLLGIFMAVGLTAILTQAITLNSTMMKATEILPEDGELFRSVWPGLFFSNVLLTALLIVLGIFVVGLSLTHKIAGPLYRLETHMRQLKAGTATRPCRLRKGDLLHEFNDLMNEATAPLLATPNTVSEDETTNDVEREAA